MIQRFSAFRSRKRMRKPRESLGHPEKLREAFTSTNRKGSTE